VVTQEDIFELKRLAKEYLLSYPSRAKIKGTENDIITFEDFRILAVYQATVSVLYRKWFSELTENMVEEARLEFEPVEGSDPY
jgi:hypothetical protein